MWCRRFCGCGGLDEVLDWWLEEFGGGECDVVYFWVCFVCVGVVVCVCLCYGFLYCVEVF